MYFVILFFHCSKNAISQAGIIKVVFWNIQEVTLDIWYRVVKDFKTQKRMDVGYHLTGDKVNASGLVYLSKFDCLICEVRLIELYPSIILRTHWWLNAWSSRNLINYDVIVVWSLNIAFTLMVSLAWKLFSRFICFCWLSWDLSRQQAE